MDQTLDAVNSLENRLSVYDELLSSVRSTMQQLSQQYNGIEVEHANLKALYSEVEDIVVCMYVCVYVCECVYVCMYVCMYIYICMYMYVRVCMYV